MTLKDLKQKEKQAVLFGTESFRHAVYRNSAMPIIPVSTAMHR